ncbi:MAG: zinc ribbon domain-containing protein [Candidatus Nanoarchaeia archaeon]
MFEKINEVIWNVVGIAISLSIGLFIINFFFPLEIIVEFIRVIFGKQKVVVKCNKCNTNNTEKAKFCSNCGKELSKEN